MKLDVDVHEVVLSNVGSTGEFKIRNSAKAFKILSDGLYSNKIRAVVRELSCNALDSHVAAGKKLVPFEVHLPTMLEPWFAVRDFGVGLNHDQVVNIYTTYFESTKTDSNDFIGALGLGSKSPFSYTENFTVTAIKDGVQRIYSAFINEMGVPSIAKMSEDEVTEANGVEVKFSVTDRNDYYSFRNEAQHVLQWFDILPNITGAGLIVQRPVFQERDIVPGVHQVNSNHSMAVMGNIPYQLNNIPEPQKHFGELASLLDCGLVLEFGIGELDFAASREQLSYVPLTLGNIKKKLELLNANLAGVMAKKADAITHPWDRAEFLQKESSSRLYKAAVTKYVKDTKFELYDPTQYYGKKTFVLEVEKLKARGLSIIAMHASPTGSSKIREHSEYVSSGKYRMSMNIPVQSDVVIVLNDLKTGIQSRARYHYVSHNGHKNVMVFCVSHTDPDLAVRQLEYNKLIAELHNPPTVVKASTLEKPERTKLATTGITNIRLKSNCNTGHSSSYMWEQYRTELDDTEIYYYVPIIGNMALDEEGNGFDVFQTKALIDNSGAIELAKIQILGVRKNRIAEIEELDNWINLKDKLIEETAKITDSNIASLLAADMLDSYHSRVYTNANVAKAVGSDSEYGKYFAKYGKIKRLSGDATALMALCELYGKAITVEAVRKDIEETKKSLYKTYPLLSFIGNADEKCIADYIKMVDKQLQP